MILVKDLEFINRGNELTLLKAYLLRERGAMPAAIVIRSPPGVGKSRLTDQLSLCSPVAGLAFCIVDPEIQGNTGSARLHDGFFIQRCAERLDSMAASAGAPWATLKDFLKSRRLKTAKEKKRSDLIDEMPSARNTYKIALDYASRLFSFGNFSPEKLLSSDRSDAVRICEEYAESILESYSIALVVREAHYCDHRSLRALVRWTESMPQLDLLIEYTAHNCEFEYGHQKLLYPLTALGRHFYVLDLVRLEAGHLEHLIRMNVRSDFAIEAQTYMSWNGNLRSIVEMQFQVLVGRKIENQHQVGEALCDLRAMVERHINSLSSLHRIILATCSAHVESVTGPVLAGAIVSIAPATSPLLLKRALSELIETHKFLIVRDDTYRIHNETVADTLRGIAAIQPLLAGAEKALRDHYSKLVFESKFEGVGMAAAVRQFFRLCARTKDVAGLLRATEVLSKEVAEAQDPSLYVEVIGSAVSADPGVYAESGDGLLRWAALLAYGVGNYAQTDHLLSQVVSPDAMCLSMHACALLETGGHDRALTIAADLRRRATQDDTRLVAELLDGLVAGCRGEQDQAHCLLTAALENPRYANSPLLGYAYRFFESIEGYVGCLDYLNRSIAWFDKFGLHRSKAFSQAATAVLTARMGNIAEARLMIEQAAQVLIAKAPSRHLLLNNMAAVDLLSDEPEPDTCKQLLSEALRYVRDDFSEVTVLSNLSLAHWVAKEFEQAKDCAEKVMNILEEHDFADQEIYWPLCLNAALVIKDSGFPERAEELMKFPVERARPPQMNRKYWAFRYGDDVLLDDQYRFLASRPYHPLYLSVWLIEPEGLNLLMQEPLQ